MFSYNLWKHCEKVILPDIRIQRRFKESFDSRKVLSFFFIIWSYKCKLGVGKYKLEFGKYKLEFGVW